MFWPAWISCLPITLVLKSTMQQSNVGLSNGYINPIREGMMSCHDFKR